MNLLGKVIAVAFNPEARRSIQAVMLGRRFPRYKRKRLPPITAAERK